VGADIDPDARTLHADQHTSRKVSVIRALGEDRTAMGDHVLGEVQRS
jgi:hypothetical protein